MTLAICYRHVLAAAALSAFATFAPRVEAAPPEAHLVIVGEPQRKQVFVPPSENMAAAHVLVDYVWTVKNTGTRESTATYLRGTCVVKSTDAPNGGDATCGGEGYGAQVPPMSAGLSAQIQGMTGVVVLCRDKDAKSASACKDYLYGAVITTKLDVAATSDSSEHVFEDNTYVDKSYFRFRIDSPPYKPAQRTWVYVKNESVHPSKPSVSSVLLECFDRGAENANKLHPAWHLKTGCQQVSLIELKPTPVSASLPQGAEIGVLQLPAMPNELSYLTADNTNVVMKTQLEIVVRAWNVSGERMVLKTY